ncbi:DUF177 domain-containing protein [bacterium]|nr:DUF177 domain-containing protein [bacterium]
MKLNISTIEDNQSVELTFNENLEPFEEVGLENKINLKANLIVSKNSDKVWIKGNLDATTKTCCHVCAEDFDLKLESDFKLLLMTNEKNAVDDSVDVKIISADTKEIDLSKEVRDELITSLPYVFKCNRKDCKVLQVSEKNNETDARWEKLKGLFPKKEN